MSNSQLDLFSNQYKELIEDQFQKSINGLEAPNILKESMLYSLEAGGKRIRPLLLFATIDAFQKDPKIGLQAACAIEMIHTYSLIHDDLPSMDDDDLRRGKPTNHIVFGEANAILAGDALLTYSFQLVAETPEETVSLKNKLDLIKLLSHSAGAEGMVGGQVADMIGEEKTLNLEELQYIHLHKTGKLLSCSILSGAILAEATQEQKSNLEKFAYHLGLAFQIRDDLLDISGDASIIGKPVGSDSENHKSTYPSLLGVNGAEEALNEHYQLAMDALYKVGGNTGLLEALTEMIVKRNH
ncbi:polyprenyl synthetase family protein [Niallia sp. Krafla_26]|uniref:polyprenyl synthetase family protein n=1 Tax=Niallia sp. Krafla_26 TaxID=3064703 RepID=UPI003D162FAD